VLSGDYEPGNLGLGENGRVEEEREETVEEGGERAEESIAKEEECRAGESGRQGEKFGEEEERRARKVVWGSASRRRRRCRRRSAYATWMRADGRADRLGRGGHAECGRSFRNRR